MTSSTGGSGALTCTAQTGYPDIAKAITGTRFVNYTIAEYTSSAKTQLSKAEEGIASYVASTGVLTRTTVKGTWDGTNYLPKFGTATAPTAISFGSTGANIDIIVAPTVSSSRSTAPAILGTNASVSDGYGSPPLNMLGLLATSLSATSGTVYYFPVELALAKMYSTVAFRQMAATTGGSPTVDIALYDVDLTTGFPGKQLLAFTQKAVGSVSDYQTTAVATPIPLESDWYWCAFLYQSGGSSGAATFKTAYNLAGGPRGSLLSASSGSFGMITLASQTVLNDPASTPTNNPNLAYIPALVFG